MAEAGYSARDVARMLDVPVSRVRHWTRQRLVHPVRGERGAYVFSFRDLVLFRTALRLTEARVPPSGIRRALTLLRREGGEDCDLASLQLDPEAGEVVVDDGGERWAPASGQLHFPFGRADAPAPAPVAPRRSPPPPPPPASAAPRPGITADGWYEVALELEDQEPREAIEAYRRALSLDADYVDAHVNLGRLLHEQDNAAGAAVHYRRAVELAPADGTAWFNLGVALEDLEQLHDALHAYEKAAETDPEDAADAHYNAAGILERLGDRTAALRHLKQYRDLVR